MSDRTADEKDTNNWWNPIMKCQISHTYKAAVVVLLEKSKHFPWINEVKINKYSQTFKQKFKCQLRWLHTDSAGEHWSGLLLS